VNEERPPLFFALPCSDHKLPRIGFFEPPDIPAEPPSAPRYRTPEWMGPAEHVVPGIVPLELLLVNIGRHAVWIGQAEVYPTGVLLNVDLHGREPAPTGIESGVGTWRFGVQFSDGRKATAFGLGLVRPGRGANSSTTTSVGGRAGHSPPGGPLLRPAGGGGSRTVYRQGYWLWPLAPPGELLVACEWPNAGIELTTATVSADLLRDAANRAKELWPPPDLPDWPGTGDRPGPTPIPPG
jgi:hypothetical protein